jgi:tetratricopeptide (TPR) repeat protein
VRVGDFGVVHFGGTDPKIVTASMSPAAELAPLSASEQLTGTGDVIGTPIDMAPEQHGGGLIDARTDQFAFAASLYRAVYGRSAFLGGSLNEIRDNVLAGRVQPIPRGAGAPRWLERSRGLEARALRPAVEAAVRRTKDERRRVTFLQRSAGLQFEDGHFEAAIEILVEALALADKVYGAESLVHADLLRDRARSLGELGKREEASAAAKQALAMVEGIVGPENPAVKAYVNVVGEQAFHTRDFDEAKAQFSRILHLSEAVDGPDAPAVAASLGNLALVATYQRDYVQAEAYYRRALALAVKRVGPEHPDVAASYYNLGILYARKGQLAEALPLQQQALAIREKALPPTHLKIVESVFQIGDLLDKLGKPDEAVVWLKRAQDIADQTLPSGHQYRVRTRITVARIYTDTKRAEQALVELAAAEEMMAATHDRLADAYLHFETARALRRARKDPARALALMKQARDTFATFPSEKEQQTRTEQFLAASPHGGR